MQNNLLIIGSIGRAHGLRGHFFVQGRFGMPLEKNLKDKVFMGAHRQDVRPVQIKESRIQGDGLVVLTDVCQSREQAQDLRGMKLWVNKDTIQVDERSEYLWEDLIGKQVMDVLGNYVGDIKQIDNFGATDVVRVCNPGDNTEYNMAFTSKFFNFNFSRLDKQIHMLVEKSFFS